MKRILRFIGKLRFEEFLAILFLLPSFLITLKANLYYIEIGEKIPRKFYGGIWRIVITVAVMLIFYYLVKKKILWDKLFWLRDVMPFIFCIAIYTNLHDTIHFVNPHDIHDYIIKIDQAIFGVQPCVWAQKFYNPYLTAYFSVSYMNYFLISVIVVVWLLYKKRNKDAREVLFGTILTFYMGYFLYILFPAAPPRIVLANQFVKDFSGGLLAKLQNDLVHISPSSSRAAFPSLHCAVTLISLLYSYKFERKLFWILLIPGISLVLATIYLRHHYVTDIIAGFILAIFAYNISPRVDAFWENVRKKLKNV